jgi:hypothetical protein
MYLYCRVQNEDNMKYFYALSCCLFIAAITLDICGKLYYSYAQGVRAKAIQPMQPGWISMEQTADTALQTGNRYTNAGLIIAGLALVSWLLTISKGKQFWHIIPLVLLVTYVLFYIMMV